MKFLIELSKVLTTILIVIFISNWNELNHIGNLRLAVVSLLVVAFTMVQFISYKVDRSKKYWY
jgi:hypothetical protein